MTTANDRFPSKFISAPDLGGKEHKLTIEKCIKEPVGRDNEEKWVVYFRGRQKGLVLNRTNDAVISSFHGDNSDKWGGKEIILYPSTVVMEGQVRPCIRVRGAHNPAEDTDLDDEIPF